jgi:hypothetical protein
MPKGDPWKPMELKMPHRTVAQLDYFAGRRGMSRSAYIRFCLDRALIGEARKLVRDDPDEAARIGIGAESSAATLADRLLRGR